MTYYLSKDVRSNEKRRAAYNALTMKTFGFSFEKWFQEGYWTEAHIPYTLFDGEKAIANVSVNKMKVLWQGEVRNYIQLGTVMTDKEYRRQGLAKKIMEEVLKDWKDKCDGIFLFANKTVLDFYPKFGFEKEEQYQFEMEIEGAFGGAVKLNMDLESDREKLKLYYEKTNPFSKLQVINNYGLLMFYCTSFMKENVYYLPQNDGVVIAEQDGEILNCMDIFCDEEKNLQEILAEMAAVGTRRVKLGFTPKDSTGFEVKQVEDEDTTLFVLKDKENIFKGNELYFPELSHT